MWPEVQRMIDTWLGVCDGTLHPTCDTPEYYHCSGGDHRSCSYDGDNICNGIGICQVAASSQADCPAG